MGTAKQFCFGVAVTVTSIARYCFGCFGDASSCSPISAGRSIGKVGIKLGGSRCVSFRVRVILASGAMICRMWNKVLRMVLCSGILEAEVQEKKWSPYMSRVALLRHVQVVCWSCGGSTGRRSLRCSRIRKVGLGRRLDGVRRERLSRGMLVKGDSSDWMHW